VDQALRAAARTELLGLLEGVRLSAWLLARGPLPERDRRLLVAIDIATERAQRAVARLEMT
jgi:hypothetical protein